MKEILKELSPNSIGRGILVENDGFIEANTDIIKQINEDISNNNKFVIPDKLIIPAILQKADVKNANGRIYPYDILRKEVERYETVIKTNRSIGENEHPDSTNIDLKNVSMRVIDIYWDKKTVCGNVEILMSPGFKKMGIATVPGDFTANLLLQGVKLGVSSRAIGTLYERDGEKYVDKDLELICWDIVTNPSTPNAWLYDEKSELKLNVESKVKSTNKINEKINKIEKLLLK